jgi:4-hydroxy-3-polyprenylbenzoate decarboxylase
VGMYRLQVVDEKTLIVHWQRHKGGAEHEERARALQQTRIPAAIVLGGDPASMWCASAPLPPEIDEYLLAGYLRGEPVALSTVSPNRWKSRPGGNRDRRVRGPD